LSAFENPIIRLEKILALTIFIGPRRTSTTSIHDYASANYPNVAPKERLLNIPIDTSILDDYFTHFRIYVEPTLFDSAAFYNWLLCVNRIVNVVVTLRDPIERFHSDYSYHRSKRFSDAGLYDYCVSQSMYSKWLIELERCRVNEHVKIELIKYDNTVGIANYLRSIHGEPRSSHPFKHKNPRVNLPKIVRLFRPLYRAFPSSVRDYLYHTVLLRALAGRKASNVFVNPEIQEGIFLADERKFYETNFK
jgi:hypothetical protein